MTANDLFCIMIILGRPGRDRLPPVRDGKRLVLHHDYILFIKVARVSFSESMGSGQANLDWRQEWRRSSLSAMAITCNYMY